VCLKNIRDGIGIQDESNGTPQNPPLFWLDNIFNIFEKKISSKDSFDAFIEGAFI
jgi:hypothetical protein